MYKVIKPRDKFKHTYVERVNDDEDWKHRCQHIWKCPESINTSKVVDGRFSRGRARLRKSVKQQNRRRSRRKWDANLDMLDVRFDKKAVDMWLICD